MSTVLTRPPHGARTKVTIGGPLPATTSPVTWGGYVAPPVKKVTLPKRPAASGVAEPTEVGSGVVLVGSPRVRALDGAQPSLAVVPPSRGALRGVKTQVWLRRFLVKMLLVFGFVVPMGAASVLSAPPKADAFSLVPSMCDFIPSYWNWDPEKPNSGVESFIAPNKDASYNGQGTMLDKYGVRGLQFAGTIWTSQDGVAKSSVAHSLPEKSCSLTNLTMNMVAGWVFDASRFLMSNTIGIQQRATDSGPILSVMQDLGSGGMFNTLRNTFFYPAIGIMIMLTGFWALGKNAQGKQREMISGAGTALMAALISVWLVAPTHQSGDYVTTGASPNFLWATSQVNKLSDDATGALATALMPEGLTKECKVGPGQPNAGRRVANCLLWDATLYRPWVTALWSPSISQYKDYPYAVPKINGTNSTNENVGNSQEYKDGKADMRFMTLDSLAYSYSQYFKKPVGSADPVIRPFFNDENAFEPKSGYLKKDYTKGGVCDWMLSSFTGQPVKESSPLPPEGNAEKLERVFNGCTKHGEYNLVRAKMQNGPDAANMMAFAGQRPVDRLSQAATSLFAAVLLGVLYIFTSLLCLMWHSIPIVLMLALPFVGLIAIFPPMLQQLKNLGQMWVKSATMGFVMGVVQMLTALLVAGIMVTGLPGGENALGSAGNTNTMSIGWKCLLLFIMVVGMFTVVKKAREDAFTANIGGSVQAGAPADRGIAKVAGLGVGVGAYAMRRRNDMRSGRRAGAAAEGRAGVGPRGGTGPGRTRRTLGSGVEVAGKAGAGAIGAGIAVGSVAKARGGERKLVKGGAPDTARKSRLGKIASTTKTTAIAAKRGAAAGAAGDVGIGGIVAAGRGATHTQRLNDREDRRVEARNRRNSLAANNRVEAQQRKDAVRDGLERGTQINKRRAAGVTGGGRRTFSDVVSDPRAAVTRNPAVNTTREQFSSRRSGAAAAAGGAAAGAAVGSALSRDGRSRRAATVGGDGGRATATDRSRLSGNGAGPRAEAMTSSGPRSEARRAATAGGDGGRATATDRSRLSGNGGGSGPRQVPSGGGSRRAVPGGGPRGDQRRTSTTGGDGGGSRQASTGGGSRSGPRRSDGPANGGQAGGPRQTGAPKRGNTEPTGSTRASSSPQQQQPRQRPAQPRAGAGAAGRRPQRPSGARTPGQGRSRDR